MMHLQIELINKKHILSVIRYFIVLMYICKYILTKKLKVIIGKSILIFYNNIDIFIIVF